MQKVVTHNGGFHADDVFAVATLQLHFGVENLEVVRTRDEEVIASGNIVVDVGGVYDPETLRFDHHQNGAPVRENGIPYSSLGMIWKEYGEQVSGSPEVAIEIEQRLILPIDAIDNGVSIYESKISNLNPVTIQDIVALMKPISKDESQIDSCFIEVCDFARKILIKAIGHTVDNLAEQKTSRQVYENAEDKRVLISEVAISAHFFIEYPDCLFLISPRDDGNWKATALRIDNDSFATRMPFLENWRGLRADELTNASGIPDAVFCHKAGFLFVAKSKEGVLAAVEKVLAQ